MSNSIDLNMRDNNPMESLSFYWMAEFKNECIFQFDKVGEHKYREVQNKRNELEFFHLYHKEKDIRFIVDLKKGIIKTLNAETPEIIEQKSNIRLIYFRRNKIVITSSGEKIEHVIIYHLGFQYNDKNGNNRQIVLTIDKDGNFVLGA